MIRTVKDYEKLSEQYNKMIAERNSLIDDLSWYKAKVSRLERELNDFDKDYEMVTNNCIYWEDKAHWLEDESSKYINLLSEISEHIGNKPSSITYKYFRGKLNALEIREEPTSMSVADMQPMTEVQLTKDMKDELQEVYRKAKAFDHIKVIYDKNMNEMSISDAECIEMIGNELECADDERKRI
ncbi:hypothetical protein P1A28_07770 [Staphylococcus equorum]|uniref:hypothetical protein n=1 Tax=Staphylococcus equorum TaxID=246432 RepID=UPI0025554902|nr:hypothetical protein [Staphylococcus equorum]MDK9843626.1 hypothetical protein [Staphylococcus equorum]